MSQGKRSGRKNPAPPQPKIRRRLDESSLCYCVFAWQNWPAAKKHRWVEQQFKKQAKEIEDAHQAFQKTKRNCRKVGRAIREKSVERLSMEKEKSEKMNSVYRRILQVINRVRETIKPRIEEGTIQGLSRGRCWIDEIERNAGSDERRQARSSLPATSCVLRQRMGNGAIANQEDTGRSMKIWKTTIALAVAIACLPSPRRRNPLNSRHKKRRQKVFSV